MYACYIDKVYIIIYIIFTKDLKSFDFLFRKLKFPHIGIFRSKLVWALDTFSGFDQIDYDS